MPVTTAHAVQALEPRRLLAAGAIDLSFGDNGIAIIRDALVPSTSDVITYPDGRILVVGGTIGDDHEVPVWRLLPGGTPDPSFGGGDGKAGLYTAPAAVNVGRTDAVLMPNGRIVVVTSPLFDPFFDPQYHSVVVGRLNPDGSPDTTFSDDGRVTINDFRDMIGGAVAVEPDGDVVVGGVINLSNWFVQRFKADGAIDAGFGLGGRVFIEEGGAEVTGMDFDADGGIIVAGRSFQYSGGYPTPASAVVRRILPTGEVDTSFGTPGTPGTAVVARNLADQTGDVDVRPDGTILLAYNRRPAGQYDPGPIKPAVARLLPNGTKDPAFPDAVAPFFGGDRFSRTSMEVQDDGRIAVLSGPRLLRFNADGTIDASFGTGGSILTPPVGFTQLALQRGKLLVAGMYPRPGGNPAYQPGVARYEAGDAPRARVVGRHVFYNHSSFDGNDAGATAADDAAIATDKNALLAGQDRLPGFDNVTSFDKGLNGVMIDVANLPIIDTLLDANDFEFSPAGNAPVSVTVRPGAGTDGSDRVTLIWRDYNPLDLSPLPQALANGWLTVTVKANAHTGLAAPDVFSFGNLIAETGDGAMPFRVNALDVAAVKRDLNAPTTITSRSDVNRDGRVNALDVALVKRNLGHSLAFPLPASTTTVAAPPRRVAEEVLS